jgi:hypothetical protein
MPKAKKTEKAKKLIQQVSETEYNKLLEKL